MDADERDVVRRALIAYLRRGEDVELETLRSRLETLDGLRYAVIRGADEVLAVYRVRRDGKLKRLRRRIPAQLRG
jgi:hypothetical protein